jgi:outer membrane protein
MNTPQHPTRTASRRRLSRLAGAAALVLLGLAPGAQAQSLVEVYEAARGFDATYLSARSQFDASVARADQAKAGLLPQVGLGAGANWTNRNSSVASLDGITNSQAVTLSASQPLYRPANNITNEQGRLSVEIARAQLLQAEQDLIVRTTQAYFDVLAADDTLTFVRALKAAVSEQLAAAKRNFEVGTSTVTDSREAQARFDLTTAQEIAAENDLLVKRLALDQLVDAASVAPKPLAAPLVLPAVVPADPQRWVNEAQARNLNVLQAQKALEIAQLETRKAQAGNLPTLDLVGQYQVARGPSGTSAIPGTVRNNNATVGLQFNLPLFAGYAIQNRVKETLALEEKSRTDLEAARRAVAQATRSAYFGVLSGQSQVKALEAAEASSQSALDANKLGYQVGVRINIDVLNAQSQLFQTKRDLAAARYNVLIGGLRLRQASGELVAADLQPIGALLQK